MLLKDEWARERRGAEEGSHKGHRRNASGQYCCLWVCFGRGGCSLFSGFLAWLEAVPGLALEFCVLNT